MLRPSWSVVCLVAALLGVTGCGSSTLTTASCSPACRVGYACASGVCVSACNPPCAASQTCTVFGSVATCVNVTPGSDGGTPMTDVPGLDSPTAATDTPQGATDTPVTGSDVSPGTDTGTPGDGGLTCGHPGQSCCNYRFCGAGVECDAVISGGSITSSMCSAYTRGALECDRPSDCTGGQQCAAGFCGMRACFQCTHPTGTTAVGGLCSDASQCTTGNCAMGQCTDPCTTDADCTVLGTGWACTALTYSGLSSSTTSESYVTHGTCARGCQRNGDCTTGQSCSPNLNYLTDHMDFICRAIFEIPQADGGVRQADPAGVMCTSGSTCQSFLCLPEGTMGVSYCTAPCITDSDCPTAAPHCNTLSVFTPSGALQSLHGCYVM